jgi:hypothetical protein
MVMSQIEVIASESKSSGALDTHMAQWRTIGFSH